MQVFKIFNVYFIVYRVIVKTLHQHQADSKSKEEYKALHNTENIDAESAVEAEVVILPEAPVRIPDNQEIARHMVENARQSAVYAHNVEDLEKEDI